MMLVCIDERKKEQRERTRHPGQQSKGGCDDLNPSPRIPCQSLPSGYDVDAEQNGEKGSRRDDHADDEERFEIECSDV
jgi:hypothetical protein